MKRPRSGCWTGTSTICALRIGGRSNNPTSTRRCAWSPGSGSIRSGACMPRSPVGPMLRSHCPRPVDTIGTRSPSASPPTVDLCEATSKEPSNSVSGRRRCRSTRHRRLRPRRTRTRQCLVLSGGHRTRRRMDGSHDRVGQEGFARPPRPRSVYAIGCLHQRGRQCQRCPVSPPTACAAAAESGSPTAQAQAHYAQGLALKSTSPIEATAELQRAADIARDAGNRWIQAFALTEVLWLEAHHGRPREALARYIDVIDLWYRGGDWANQWLSLRHVFGILVQLRADLGAATLHGALTAAGSAYALPFEAADAQRIGVLVDDLRDRLGAAAFASAVRRGTTLSDGEIIDFVRAQIHVLAGVTHGG